MTQYTITKYPTGFTRRGYVVRLWNDDGTPYTRLLTIDYTRYHDGTPTMRRRGPFDAIYYPDSEPVHFYGDDGRKVRAEAVAFAKSHNATLKRA